MLNYSVAELRVFTLQTFKAKKAKLLQTKGWILLFYW